MDDDLRLLLDARERLSESLSYADILETATLSQSAESQESRVEQVRIRASEGIKPP